jgi:hypothetical protein
MEKIICDRQNLIYQLVAEISKHLGYKKNSKAEDNY